MKKVLACVLILAGLVLAGHGFAGRAVAAETDNKSVTVTFTLLSHMEMTLTDAVAFGEVEPDAADVHANCVTLTVKSNKAYKVVYTVPQEFVKSGGETIGINHLSYSVGGGAYTAFASAGGTPIATSPRTNEATHVWNYKLLIDYDHAPDTYSGTITYTISPAGS